MMYPRYVPLGWDEMQEIHIESEHTSEQKNNVLSANVFSMSYATTEVEYLNEKVALASWKPSYRYVAVQDDRQHFKSC